MHNTSLENKTKKATSALRAAEDNLRAAMQTILLLKNKCKSLESQIDALNTALDQARVEAQIKQTKKLAKKKEQKDVDP
jgi:multidrug efflux pump subunit AcrA (membrane-fusion protein)